MHLLTIIIPYYNRASALKFTLKSIFNSIEKEYIKVKLINNCSEDFVKSDLKEYLDKGLELINYDTYQDMADNWNRALTHSNTEFTALMHVGDIYIKDTISKIQELLIENRKYDAYIFGERILNKCDRFAKNHEDIVSKKLFPNITQIIWKTKSIKFKFQQKYFPCFDYIEICRVILNKKIFYSEISLVQRSYDLDNITFKCNWSEGAIRIIKDNYISKLKIEKNLKSKIYFNVLTMVLRQSKAFLLRKEFKNFFLTLFNLIAAHIY